MSTKEEGKTQRCKILCPQEGCDAYMKVLPLDTEFEFRAECPNGHARTISWAHHNDPPTYEAASEEAQQSLFGEQP